MLIYQIKLPKKQDSEAFVKFMKTEYLPAVHKGPTRVGQVTEVSLLQDEANDHFFYLNVAWSGMKGHEGFRIDDETVSGKFETSGARIQQIGAFAEVARSKKGRSSAG